MDYVSRFFKKFKNPWVKLSRFGRKTQLFGKFLRKSSKTSLENSKNALSWSISKIISKPCVRFSHVLAKNSIVWRIFEKIFKIFLRKWQKMHYFSLFSTKF